MFRLMGRGLYLLREVGRQIPSWLGALGILGIGQGTLGFRLGPCAGDILRGLRYGAYRVFLGRLSPQVEELRVMPLLPTVTLQHTHPILVRGKPARLS